MKKGILESCGRSRSRVETDDGNLFFVQGVNDVAVSLSITVHVSDVATVRKGGRFRWDNTFEGLPVLKGF